MNLPGYVSAVLERLNRHGFEAVAVGGCVRDALLGKTPDDWDIATAATPEETLSVFADVRTVETGLKHGTVTVIIDGHPLEITTYRFEGTYSDNRHPDRVVFTTSLRDDLARRDFTVNAMAWHPQKGLIDCFGGQKDLEDRVLRCVGNPQLRFREDALRIVRAVRFASVLGFSIEKNTAAAIHGNATLLHNVSVERIATEMTKLLCGKAVRDVMTAYSDVITTVIPELAATVNFAQTGPYHNHDIYTHIAIVVENTPADDKYLRWAALLHDCAKPKYFTRDANGAHFRGHPAGSAEMAAHALRRLHLDNQTVETVTTLILCHDETVENSPSSLLHWLGRLGEENLRRLLCLQRADTLGKSPEMAVQLTEIAEVEKTLDALLRQNPCYSLAQLKVSGNDLIDIGVPAGPMVGQLLHILLDAVIDGRCANEKSALLNVLKDLYR